MANKAISELPQAQNVNNQDLFVLEQSGIAKKLTAETFITEQGIIDALAEALDGHGGIQSVTLSSVSGRIRTYRITFTDQSATTFQVYDGTSIDRISRTSSSGLDDVYTIFLSDGTTTFFTVHNGADGTVSEAMLNDALKDKAPAITETTESSAIATFTDGADDLVMHNVVVEINPVQSGSGDPSPSNIRPISGWTGCNVTRTGINIWDEQWESGSIGGADGQPTLDDTRIRSKNFCACLPSTQYYCVNSLGTLNVAFYDANKNYISMSGNATNNTFTTPANCRWFKIRVVATTYSSGVSINYPVSERTYHASNVSTVSVTWQTEAGTVYGGTIDVATGLLTVTHGYATDNGTSGWNRNSSGSFYKLVSFASLAANNSDGLCNYCKYLYSNNPPYMAMFVRSSNGTISLSSHWGTFYSTTDELCAAFAENPLQMVYPLATPQTYQLTPQQLLTTLLGTNNVWADTGNVSVTYPADTKLYIQNLTQPSEDDMTADHAISSGTFFMLGNNLYLATAAIASGATIIEGTNATRLSLADALNRLS